MSKIARNNFSVTHIMAFVPVPKDLSKVKNRVALNLTKRQLICFSLAGTVGIPTYVFSRSVIGNDGAVFLMIGLMLPFFFIAMYERDGQPAEKLLRNYIRARLFFPRKRTYMTENFYLILSKEENPVVRKNKKAKESGKTSAKRKPPGKER